MRLETGEITAAVRAICRQGIINGERDAEGEIWLPHREKPILATINQSVEMINSRREACCTFVRECPCRILINGRHRAAHLLIVNDVFMRLLRDHKCHDSGSSPCDARLAPCNTLAASSSAPMHFFIMILKQYR